MTQTKTAAPPAGPPAAQRPKPKEQPKQEREALPTWRNTRPRGNPEPHEGDLARSRERWEALLGR